jgi:hypothetical protein
MPAGWTAGRSGAAPGAVLARAAAAAVLIGAGPADAALAAPALAAPVLVAAAAMPAGASQDASRMAAPRARRRRDRPPPGPACADLGFRGRGGPAAPGPDGADVPEMAAGMAVPAQVRGMSAPASRSELNWPRPPASTTGGRSQRVRGDFSGTLTPRSPCGPCQSMVADCRGAAWRARAGCGRTAATPTRTL